EFFKALNGFHNLKQMNSTLPILPGEALTASSVVKVGGGLVAKVSYHAAILSTSIQYTILR
ncbi:MAG TPA: hypothetical protein PLU50_09235, partial [Pseudobdellovibrionaceae bacterium]|nr:hypothetical protein [Pseudobdellovibrionaceae bacterium]